MKILSKAKIRNKKNGKIRLIRIIDTGNSFQVVELFGKVWLVRREFRYIKKLIPFMKAAEYFESLIA